MVNGMRMSDTGWKNWMILEKRLCLPKRSTLALKRLHRAITRQMIPKIRIFESLPPVLTTRITSDMHVINPESEGRI